MSGNASTTLNTEAEMPTIGLGCWMGKRVEGLNQETYDMVINALKVGYRSIDTACGYGNEEAVGKAIRDSGVERKDIFVTTKLQGKDHGRVQQGFETSLKALGLGYIDLYLVHWPQANDPETGTAIPIDQSPTIPETWAEMERLLGDRCKAIGVSNFSPKTLDTLLSKAKVTPAVNQVESHIYLPQVTLDIYCREKGIILTAYSPLGQPKSGGTSPVLQEKLVLDLAKKYDVGAGTILLSWVAQRPNWNIIPKSSNPKRMADNFKLIKLDQSDFDALSQVHQEEGKLRRLCIGQEEIHKTGVVGGWSLKDMGWEKMN